MKKLAAVVFVMSVLVSSVFAGNLPNVTKNVTFSRIESNLLSSINSGNEGLSVSSLQRLGDIKSDRAVVPLMGVLKSNASVSEKIAAAVSLYKIGDARGIFAVKQAAKYDASSRVRQLCARIYTQFQIEG